MKAMRIILVTLGLAGVLAPGYVSYQYPRWKVESHLNGQGLTNVQLSLAWWNKAPFWCGGEDDIKFNYVASRPTAKGPQKVTGFACYKGWLLGTYSWNDGE